ncbi:MAG: biotin/lipoyl-containing protein [Bacteroidota bacterium]|nr:biotin/lipoyl-containing protein [Bacteroidota bacterium]
MSDDTNKMEFEDFVVESMKYKTLLTKKHKNREKYTPNNPKKIISVLPGTIIEIMVKPGDLVTSGDPLLISESMKMNNIVATPIDGTIKKVHIKIGDRIPKNTLLIELE